MKKKILLLDGSKTINAALSYTLNQETEMTVLSGFSMSDCVTFVGQHKHEIILAVTCMYLPGAYEGETIDYLISHNLPVVVLTGNFDDETRTELYAKRVSDYYLKESFNSVNQVVSGVKRLIENRGLRVLILDEDIPRRESLSDLLKRQLLDVDFAENLEQTRVHLENSPQTKIIISNEKHALELLKELRENYSKENLSIVVIAEENEKNRAAQLIKYGANDYLQKPFCNEEFFSKIGLQLEILKLFQLAVDRANKDFMTGMHNRRYFFDEGMRAFNQARKEKTPIAVAMIDIDKFKNINDTYGHDIGDIAIKEVAHILSQNLEEYSALISRFGGEEFCMIVIGVQPLHVIERFETIRKCFESNIIQEGDVSFSYTVSTGLHFPGDETLDEAVKKADENLYTAKESGRNKVVHNHLS